MPDVDRTAVSLVSVVSAAACDRPAARAVISLDQVWTFADLMDRADGWAEQVSGMGMVEIGGGVRPELIPMLLGCWLAGTGYRLIESGDEPPRRVDGPADPTVALVDGDLLIPHHAVSALTRLNLFGPTDTVLATHASVVALLVPLAAGAAVTLDERIEHTVIVGSADRVSGDPGVRVVLSGDQLAPARLPEHAVGLPGPDGAPWGVVRTDSARRSLGLPMPGRTRYVLGEGGDVVPIGGWGELWADAPVGVLDDPRTTADRCRPDPYPKRPGARIFRTGLRVQFHGTGTITQPWPQALPPTGAVAGQTEPETGSPELTVATLQGIWQSVLGTSAGPHDDFFELGGDSLLATQIVLILRDSYDVDLRVWQLLEAPTLAQLAEIVEFDHPQVTPAPRPAAESDVRGAAATYAQDLISRTEWLAPGVGGSYVVRTPLPGVVDPTALVAALTAVIERHEALRCTFRQVGERVEAVVSDRVEYDLREVETSDPAALPRLVDELLDEPFDLTRGPLLRVVLVALDDSYELLFCVQEAVFDRWSAAILRADFEAALHGRSLGAPPCGFVDLGQRQRDHRLGLGRWARLLADPQLTSIEWPGEPAREHAQGTLRAVRIDTPAMAISHRQYLAAFAHVLGYYCEGSPVIALTTDDRAHFGVGSMIGNLSNTRFVRDGSDTAPSDNLPWIPVEYLTDRVPIDTAVALQAGFATVPDSDWTHRRAGRWDADVTLELGVPKLRYRAEVISADTATILARDLARTLAEQCTRTNVS